MDKLTKHEQLLILKASQDMKLASELPEELKKYLLNFNTFTFLRQSGLSLKDLSEELDEDTYAKVKSTYILAKNEEFHSQYGLVEPSND